MNVKDLRKELDQVGRSVRFVSLLYRTKKNGELARYTVNVGLDYEHVLIKSLSQLQKRLSKFEGVKKQAANELYDSILNSLLRYKEGLSNDNYTKKDVYVSVGNGLRVNLQDGTFELFGYIRHKKVLEEGAENKTKSSEKTKAKNEIRKTLPIGKFRSFALDSETIQSVKLNKKTLEFQVAEKQNT